MATVNSYTAPKIDDLINGRAPVNHTHTLEEAGIGPWIDWRSEVKLWSSGSLTDITVETPGSTGWDFCRYRMIGDDTMHYQGQFTFATSTGQPAGRNLAFSSPRSWDGGRQPSAATVFRAGAYVSGGALLTQGIGVANNSPEHYVFGFVGWTDGGFLDSNGWSNGDLIAWNVTVKV